MKRLICTKNRGPGRSPETEEMALTISKGRQAKLDKKPTKNLLPEGSRQFGDFARQFPLRTP